MVRVEREKQSAWYDATENGKHNACTCKVRALRNGVREMAESQIGRGGVISLLGSALHRTSDYSPSSGHVPQLTLLSYTDLPLVPTSVPFALAPVPARHR